MTRLPGLVGTTSSRHAQSPDVVDWTPLAGKEVIILAAHDEAEQTGVKQAVEQLARLSPSPTVRVLSLPMVWQTAPQCRLVTTSSTGSSGVPRRGRRGPLCPGALERRPGPPVSLPGDETIRRNIPLSRALHSRQPTGDRGPGRPPTTDHAGPKRSREFGFASNPHQPEAQAPKPISREPAVEVLVHRQPEPGSFPAATIAFTRRSSPAIMKRRTSCAGHPFAAG